AFDGGELLVQIGERATFAGDVDEVSAAAMKHERFGIEQLDHVRSAYLGGNMAAAHPHAVLVGPPAPTRKRVPARPLRRASRCYQPSLGKAIALVQRRTVARLRFGRYIGSERRGGREDEPKPRQTDVIPKQCTQMHRGRDEDAWLG